MADTCVSSALHVVCSDEELNWARAKFQATDKSFIVSVERFSEEINNFSMEGEPIFAEKLVCQIFAKFKELVYFEEILFF